MSAKRAVEVAMKKRGRESNADMDADYEDNPNGFIYGYMALHPSPPHSPLVVGLFLDKWYYPDKLELFISARQQHGNIEFSIVRR